MMKFSPFLIFLACIFVSYRNFTSKSTSNLKIIKKEFYFIFKPNIQMSQFHQKITYFPAHRMHSGPSTDLKHFNNEPETPCSSMVQS